MNWKSLHALGGRRLCQVVSPGGNGAGVGDQLLGQQSHEELAEEPGLGAFVVVLGQMPELCQRFETLEHQLDLPAGAVPLQHVRYAELRFRERREDDHVLGKLQGLRLQLRALLGSLLAQALVRDANRFPGLAQRAHPPGHRSALLVDGLDSPRPDRPGAPHRLDGFQQVERLVFPCAERQRLRVDPDRQPTAGLGHIADASGGRIAPLRQQVIPRLHREMHEALSRAAPLRRRQLEEVAGQRRQPHTVMHAPQRPRLARLLHRRRIDRPDLQARTRVQLHPSLPEQLHAQGPQPSLRLLQPVP